MRARRSAASKITGELELDRVVHSVPLVLGGPVRTTTRLARRPNAAPRTSARAPPRAVRRPYAVLACTHVRRRNYTANGPPPAPETSRGPPGRRSTPTRRRAWPGRLGRLLPSAGLAQGSAPFRPDAAPPGKRLVSWLRGPCQPARGGSSLSEMTSMSNDHGMAAACWRWMSASRVR